MNCDAQIWMAEQQIYARERDGTARIARARRWLDDGHMVSECDDERRKRLRTQLDSLVAPPGDPATGFLLWTVLATAQCRLVAKVPPQGAPYVVRASLRERLAGAPCAPALETPDGPVGGGTRCGAPPPAVAVRGQPGRPVWPARPGRPAPTPSQQHGSIHAIRLGRRAGAQHDHAAMG